LTLTGGGGSARPFLPAKDFEVSRAFYESLGFNKLLDGDVAIFEIGSTSFILQKRFEKTWAENCMMQLMVDDLDAWWKHIESLDLPKRFGLDIWSTLRGPMAHSTAAHWGSMGLVRTQRDLTFCC
jgi:hypothetical protein